MYSTNKYISINQQQADALNECLNTSTETDENAFYDGCELLVEFEYDISDESHDVGVEKIICVDILDIFAIIEDEKVNTNDLFDLTSEQLDELQSHALEDAKAQKNNVDYSYDDSADYEN